MAVGLDPATALQVVPSIYVLCVAYGVLVVLPSTALLRAEDAWDWGRIGVLHATIAASLAAMALRASWLGEVPLRMMVDVVFVVLLLAVPIGIGSGLLCWRLWPRR